MKHSQQLGQNFVVMPFYLERMLSIAEIAPSDIVLEIGTGYGCLTSLLCEKAKKVLSFEIDKKLYLYSKEKLSSYKNLLLFNADGLSCTEGFNKVVSNLPYSISKRFIYWLALKTFQSATVMLQKDFVKKIMSPPGTKHYRAVSVISQLAFKLSLFDEVPPVAFNPVPKVHSMILKIEPVNPPLLNEFLMRMINYLSTFKGKKVNAIIKKTPFTDLNDIKNISGLKEKRIETLSPDEYLMLATFLSERI
ncbi:MAG: rRNA adenine N-6-methyltransferase family protein [Nitrososphaeria archaeon]